VRITRTRIVAGKTSRETAYRIISLPAEHAQPAELGDWARREWLIENQVHHIRDITFREDAQRAGTGTGPAVAAVLRNTAIGFTAPTAKPTSPELRDAPTGPCWRFGDLVGVLNVGLVAVAVMITWRSVSLPLSRP
jgi:hypothetical protein